MIAVWTLILPHSFLIIMYIFNNNEQIAVNVIFAILCAINHFSIIKFNIVPLAKKESSNKRLNILAGGRRLLLTSIYVGVTQSLLFVTAFVKLDVLPFNIYLITTDLIINAAFIALIYINGFFRIVILSRRLNMIKKVLYVLFMWIPIVSLFFIKDMCRAVSDEYSHELYKINQDKWRVDTRLCNTNIHY